MKDKEKLRSLYSKFRRISLTVSPTKEEEEYLKSLREWEKRSRKGSMRI